MKNIFVGNLNFGATEAAVRSLFEQYGSVERVNIITDRDTGQPRGFGFVEMSANSEADRAIAELNGRELDGRALNVAASCFFKSRIVRTLVRSAKSCCLGFRAQKPRAQPSAERFESDC
jgi:cold-inducible RNA-binding protein